MRSKKAAEKKVAAEKATARKQTKPAPSEDEAEGMRRLTQLEELVQGVSEKLEEMAKPEQEKVITELTDSI